MRPKTLAWLVLLASAVLEAVWATALGLSQSFTQPAPTAVFAVTSTLSLLGLGYAVRTIPLGTGYAVWVGIGAALTVLWAMATGDEAFSVFKLLFIAGIVACVGGLKALPEETSRKGALPEPEQPAAHAPATAGEGVRNALKDV